jgi:hypothetical protein
VTESQGRSRGRPFRFRGDFSVSICVREKPLNLWLTDSACSADQGLIAARARHVGYFQRSSVGLRLGATDPTWTGTYSNNQKFQLTISQVNRFRAQVKISERIDRPISAGPDPGLFASDRRHQVCAVGDRQSPGRDSDHRPRERQHHPDPGQRHAELGGNPFPRGVLTQLAQLGGGFCDFARDGASWIKGLDGAGG